MKREIIGLFSGVLAINLLWLAMSAAVVVLVCKWFGVI